MKQELLEKFADECERLAEEKETEREWLSDYANMVLEEAAKVCDTKAEFMAMMGGSCDPDVLAEQIRALKEPYAKVRGPQATLPPEAPSPLPGYAGDNNGEQK